MKKLVCLFAAFVGLPVAMAQDSDRPGGQGYVIIAPAASDGRAHAAVGGEAFVFKGLTFGAEAGPVFRWSGFNDSVFALGSVNISYHFLTKAEGLKIEPFVTAGYSVFVRAGVENGSNAGGGFQLWLKKNVGIRLEFRQYIGVVRIHDVGPRFGLIFR
jgi:hypothetical protein